MSILSESFFLEPIQEPIQELIQELVWELEQTV
jgi:hypothetical protein